MLFNGSRPRNLLPQVAQIRGWEWLFFHGTDAFGSFGYLGGGYATWIIHGMFMVPRAGWYAMTIACAPHTQVMIGGEPLQGFAGCKQGSRKTENPIVVNDGDTIVMYLDPGECEFQVQIPICGNGSGTQPAEPQLRLVPGPNAGDIVILNPGIAPLLVVGSVPGPVVTSAPATIVAPPVVVASTQVVVPPPVVTASPGGPITVGPP